jgi:hypothetical protein
MSDKKHIYYSYSKFNRAKQCWLKFYGAHVAKEVAENPAHDTVASYVGIMTQHIFEAVVNNRETLGPLFNLMDSQEIWDQNFLNLCKDIDSDLKLLWEYIKSTEEYVTDFDTQELFALNDAVLLTHSTKCAYDKSKYLNEYQACNSVIKKIRELYKTPLHSFLSQFNLTEVECEVQLNDIVIELDEPGYSEYVIHMKGTMDFLWTAGSTQRYPDQQLIIDGKKSLGSFLDSTQLKFYTIMMASKTIFGWRKGSPLLGSVFWGFTEDKYLGKNGSATPFIFTEEERVALVKDIIDTHKKQENWKGESDYPPRPEFGSCMFCDRKDNCLAQGTAKGDIDEI